MTDLMHLRDVSVVHKIRGEGLFGSAAVHALTGATLTIRPGETVGVVGESGCGKTTLARVLVGLQRPSAGEVSFRGKSLWSMSARERRLTFGAHIGTVFQDPSTALNRRMSVQRIIADPLVVHQRGSRASRAERVRELMDLVGLPTAVADALPSQLSGGQRQRVAIARALALEPALLVADEPTSALDVSVRAQILNLLDVLQRELGLAMVFVSHDIQTVRRMSDRIVTMYLGRIAEEAPATGVSRHPYTHALFAATPRLLTATEPIPLRGRVPSATNPPSGCNFRTRCWRATPECGEALPPLTVEEPGVSYRCLHPMADEDQF
ncbi:ATP-binding cassette domain-containing protein [Kineosporia mesophila]|uniref:ATP-binding cassette domain-containing protein n=1 Tax=Kineosporia mesophila TaxID=566012 RepID=A0ABP7AEE1_9ACTN|nr:ABC transporter ATP-binding protein [Kineosporia mesophila]MCD5352862.1 ABC transporter ATP-binding protein [Kineosporia mesophila]